MDKIVMKIYLLCLIFSLNFGVANSHPFRDQQTEALYNNLKKISGKSILFGMSNPTTIGYKNGVNSDINQSDCKDITGSHPAFHEGDLMWHVFPDFKKTDLQAMKAAFSRGAVIGYCWHLRDMKTDSFYVNRKNATLVHDIVSDRNRYKNPALDWYLKQLDEVAIPVFKELGFPVIFRPFHEMNGNWFWWGKRWCTTDEYKELYRLTVDYLRNSGLKNLLFAWSPDATDGLEFYPGDDYVDILGMDIYEPGVDPMKSHAKLLHDLGILTDYAANNGKVVALTECGCRKEKNIKRYPDLYPDFWTKYVLEPILNDEKAKRIVWISAWINADWNKDDNGEVYIPYKGWSTPKGIEAISDFRKFYNNPVTLFEVDMPDIYH